MPNKKTKMKNTRRELPPQGDAWPKHEFFLFEPKTLAIVIVTSVLTLLIAFFGEQGSKFLTSVISPVPEHSPYDGVTFPIKQMPNWVKLTEAERKMTFNQLPPEKIVPIVAYNPSHLAIPVATLKWNDPNDDIIRNEKITYSTPYLGNYKLDGLENVGSHPAIDIKVPEGTPVYAIANGTVIKTAISSGGFGNHVVVQHNNFPSFEDQSKTTTLYSSYNHLSSISVNMNTVITKGQLVGFSGSTGTATTPHLHFQIDTDSAKWHPYWPFTTGEMNSAGYSFFEAINNGLGQKNAIIDTINPMKYVQRYAGDQGLLVTSNAPFTQALEDKYKDVSFSIQVVGSSNKLLEGDTLKVIVQAFDKDGNLLNKPDFKDDIKLSLLNGNGQLNQSSIFAVNLKTGISNLVRISNLKIGREKVLLRFREKEFSSQEFEILPKIPQAARFRILPDKTELNLNEIVQVSILALDASENNLNDFTLDENPLVGQTLSLGSFSLNSLTRENFASDGSAKVSFTAATPGEMQIVVNYHGTAFQSSKIKVLEPPPLPAPVEQPVVPAVIPVEQPVVTPEQPVAITPPTDVQPVNTETTTQPTNTEVQPEQIVVPVVPVIPVVVPSVPSKPLPFSDIPETSVYFEALTELKTAGLVAGYSDGTFQPDKKVSRAEAITFILRAINETIREKIDVKFPDVPLEVWFAKYVSTAFELGFVKGYPDGYFRPQAEVTLSEFFTMIFVAAKIDIDPQIQITMPTGVDVAAWYAPYLQEAIRRNILEIKDNALDPSRSMTRGEISLILYRLQKLEKEGNGL